MFKSAASTRSDRLALALAALLLAAYVVLRYGDSVRTFLVLDDFWILRDASRADWSPGGLAQLFQFTQTGFQLYRPLTQRAYFFVLHAVFGTDTSGFHLVQLTCFASNVLLAMAIATRLTASRLAGFAVALLYAAAPGHAVAVYWMAAFTMTGTTFVVFLMVRCWQTSARPTRLVAVTLLQIVALLLQRARDDGAGPPAVRRGVLAAAGRLAHRAARSVRRAPRGRRLRGAQSRLLLEPSLAGVRL